MKAGVDIGTNTVRLLILDGEREVYRRTVVVGLGRDRGDDGTLSEASMERTVAALEHFGNALGENGVTDVKAVATSASRDAPNRDDFLTRAERALGWRPGVITGEEEAALSFAGARAGLPEVDLPVLVIDPGGGSTEFVMGTDMVDFARSVDVGSVRLTGELLSERPPAVGDLEAARSHVARVLSGIELPRAAGTVIGVAGTFTSLAAIALGLKSYDREAVHGTVMRRSGLAALTEELAGMTVAETASIPSLDPGRAPVILAGAVIAEAALAVSRCDELVVSESDLLDALVL